MLNSARIGGMAAAVLGLALFGATAANAASASVTVTPNTGLSNGQQVAVAGSGFAANSDVLVVECLNSTTTASCDVADEVGVSADAAGGVSAKLTVRQSFAGANPSSGAATGQVDCTVSPGCAVVAINSSTVAAAQISFG